MSQLVFKISACLSNTRMESHASLSNGRITTFSCCNFIPHQW